MGVGVGSGVGGDWERRHACSSQLRLFQPVCQVAVLHQGLGAGRCRGGDELVQ